MINNVFLWVLGGWEILLIVVIILVFFGAKRIPELARGLGKGIKEFKTATREESKDKKDDDNEAQQDSKKIQN